MVSGLTSYRPSGVNVGVNNPGTTIYITGNESTDGSIRLILESGETIANIELRTSGIWNDTSLRFSSGSVEVGRDLKLEAAADFIKTENPSGFSVHSIALVPHIPFSSTGTIFPHTPIADVLADNVIFSTAISETSGTTISQTFSITSAQIIDTIEYEVGTVGATNEVRHTIYKGTDNTGSVISQMNLPASDFIANTTATIDFGSAFGFSDEHSDIFVEFVTDISFTLKTDSSGNILIKISSQQLETRDLLYEDLMLDENLGIMFNEELSPMYGIQFP